MSSNVTRDDDVKVGQPRTRVRIGVLALISFATMLNYLDRAVMGVAAPAITEEFSVSPAMLGVLFSAFSWTYALSQIPGGLVLDRLGTRLTYSLSLGLWSLFTLLHGLAVNVAMLLGFRLGLGAAEAPCFPTNSRVLSTWFPQTERARANSVYAVGQYVGLAFFSPVLFWIVAAWGWRALFLIFGARGIGYAFLWHAIYREPRESRSVSRAELDYIAAGGGLEHTGETGPFSWRNCARLLGKRQILGASIGQFCGNSTLVFFLTWFPTYLATERGILASRSPRMHEREADAQGLRLLYSLFDFAELGLSEADLPRMLAATELAGFSGVNVTHPFKQTVIAHLDSISSEAERIGAVNTVAFRDGKKIGYNTDVTGFAGACRHALASASMERVVQMGAGGGGAATAFALLELGVSRLTLFDLDQGRAEALASRLERHFDASRIGIGRALPDALAAADGLVNATPMGMAEHPGTAVPVEMLRPDLWAERPMHSV